jgi:hypothetical protein
VRAVLLLVAVATGVAGLGTLWVTGLIALWDSGWRLTYVFATGMVLLVLAGVALYGALSRPAADHAAAVQLPAAWTGVEADVFPRSTAMRLAIIALPVLARIAPRSRTLRLLGAALGWRQP